MKRVIVFSGSKMKVKQLAAALQQIGINCGAMHSDLEQAERDDVMFKFKSGQFDVLVATDIVARGIDIDDIEMVINYDVPHDTEDYVHRIGRTARANRDGRAITFVNEEDQYWFQQIEKFLEKVVEKMPLPEVCGEGPEYIKLNKPSKRNNGRKGKGGNNRGGNRSGNRGDNNNNNGEGKSKTSAKSRRQKDRDQTSHKRKPNKPNERQEKTPQNNGENGEQKNRNNNKRRNNNKQRNNENGKQQGHQQSNGNQRPGNENNVRPGSNGRGRGVAQKKQGGAQQNQQKRQGAAPQNQQKKGTENAGPRKYAPVVNPQKSDNPVKKFIKRIFGFGK